MNLREQIRRALNDEGTKKLITKIRRRIPDLDDVVRRMTDWAMTHYEGRLNDVSDKWFVETVIYNVYVDTITPIFEGWDEYNDEISFELSNKEAKNILNFLTEHYFDVISERFNKRYKDDKLNESINTDYAVIEILKPSSRMPLKWYFQAVPLNKTKEDKIYIKRGPAGILTISTKNIKIHKIFKKSEKEEMDKYLEKLRDEDTKKGINESLRQMIRLLKETKERIVFDIQDLLDRGIIFITQAHDLKTGKMIPPEVDPDTGEMYHDSTNLITLWNILYPEQGEQDGIPKALKHPRPDQVQYWQEHQDELGEEKYNQILRSIELEESNKEEMTEEELTEKCWKGYTQKGMKTMFGKRYPNCVKKTK